MWRRQVRAQRRARCSCHVSSVHCRFSSVLVGLRGSGGWKRPNAIVHLTFQFECHHVRIVSFLSKPRNFDMSGERTSARSFWKDCPVASLEVSLSAQAGYRDMSLQTQLAKWSSRMTPAVGTKADIVSLMNCWVIVAQWKVSFLGCSRSFIHKSSVSEFWIA